MALTDDSTARALQVMFILREPRGRVRFNALASSGISPVEARTLNNGHHYTTMFGWPEPFADGTDKKDRCAAAEHTTNARMAEILAAALDPGEADELGRRSAAALAESLPTNAELDVSRAQNDSARTLSRYTAARPAQWTRLPSRQPRECAGQCAPAGAYVPDMRSPTSSLPRAMLTVISAVPTRLAGAPLIVTGHREMVRDGKESFIDGYRG
jgi:hypothetical protein